MPIRGPIKQFKYPKRIFNISRRGTSFVGFVQVYILALLQSEVNYNILLTGSGTRLSQTSFYTPRVLL